MNHLTKAAHIRDEILKKMSPAEKWQQVLKLRQVAWQLKSAAVKLEHPDWDSGQVYEAVRKIFVNART